MTDDDMAKIAEILRRQLRAAPPETYRFVWGVVFDMHTDFESWFSAVDPEFLPDRFYNLIFEDYPADLYEGGEVNPRRT